MSVSYPSSSGYTDFANPRLESHMTFVCPECGVEFESQQDWRRHLNEEHDYIHKTPADFDFKVISDSFHECQVCHKWVANANQAIALLQYHRFLHLPYNRTYRCRHCKGGFTRKRALCEHLYRFHSRQIILAEKMRQTENEIIPNMQHTNELKSLKDPRLNAEFYLRFICPHCGKNIDKYEQWLKHLDYHQSTSNDLRMHRISGSRNHYCLQCRKLLYTNEQQKLQRHRFTHLPFRLYFKCAFCMVKKSFKSEIFRHFIYAHPRQFTEAKLYIKKPIEFGAKINDRLNTELDAILKRYKVPDASSSNQRTDAFSNTNQSGRPQTKQTYASEKARLAAQHQQQQLKQQKCEQDQKMKKMMEATTLNTKKFNMRIIKDYHKVEQKHDISTHTESTTEDDFEELCADVFESIEEESQSSIQTQLGRHKQTNEGSTENNSNGIKVENCKQEYSMDEEQIISIEINTMSEDNETESFIRTPPRKRLKLSKPESSLPQEKSSRTVEHTKIKSDDSDFKKITTTTPIANESNKKALLEENIHYLCPECGSEFDEQSSWREHVFNEHNIENAIQTNFQLLENQKSYLCLDCMDVQHTTKYSELQRHRFMHMPFQAYLKCKICKKTKSSKPKMLHHLQECHDYDDSIIKCKQQPSTDTEDGREEITASAAKITTQPKQFYPCEKCQKYFTTEERLKLHRTVDDGCEVRVNGLQGRNNNVVSNNTNSKSNDCISKNMKLLAHLKQAHARMKRMLAAETM